MKALVYHGPIVRVDTSTICGIPLRSPEPPSAQFLPKHTHAAERLPSA